MKKFFLNLLDLIYKKRCYFCKSSRENSSMCQKCYDDLNFKNPSEIMEINKTKIYCAGVYEKNIQKLIRGVKYHNQKDLAYFQAKFMKTYFEKLNLNKNFQVVPVPLFKTREKQRGYNHMDLVGEEFCKQTGFSLNTNLIKRVKNTKPQYKLTRKERMENLKEAFEVEPSNFDKNCDILIIDDIFTTDSTFEAMIKEFHKHSIYNITCLSTATARD